MKVTARWLAVVVVGAVLAGACSSDDGDDTTATDAASAPTSAGEATAGATTEPATDSTAAADTTVGSGATAGSETTGGDGTAPASGDPETTLTVGAVLAPPTLDITTDSGAGIPQLLLYNVYETLVKIDDQGEFQPLLAEELPEVSEDGLTYTFTLRDGITFHSGDELTSEDVKFSFDRAKGLEAAPSIIASTFATVASVEAPDPQTVVITLNNPSRNFLYNIAQTSGVVINEGSVDTLASDANGSGPFELDSFSPPESARLTRFDGYWGDPAGVAAVEMRYITDANALANAARAGDIDIITNLAPELFGEFENDTGNFQTVNGITSGETIVTMNNARPPLDQPEVRQAITHAINKEEILEAAESGYGMIIGTHSAPTDPWFTEIDEYPYDPELARTMLEEAGVTGTPLTLRLPPTPYAQAAGPIVQQQLNDVGFDVQIENVEFPLWISDVFGQSDFDLTIISHVEARDVVRFGDPEYYWNYDNPDVAALLEQADQTTDVAESDELYQQVLQQIAEDAPVVWMFLLPDLRVIRNGVSNYPENSYSLSFDMTGITKE